MLSTGSFFDLSEFPYADLFNDCPQVHDPLRKLKDYMTIHTTPTFQHLCLRDGVPLSSPFLLHNGRLRDARECIITYGDTNKEGLVVWENGAVLKGASVIMAGAIITGKNIRMHVACQDCCTDVLILP